MPEVIGIMERRAHVDPLERRRQMLEVLRGIDVGAEDDLVLAQEDEDLPGLRTQPTPSKAEIFPVRVIAGFPEFGVYECLELVIHGEEIGEGDKVRRSPW